MDKLQFSFRQAPSLVIDGQKVDLASQTTTVQILDKQGNPKTIQGFQAADGTLFRLKQRAQGDGVDLVIYGQPQTLSKYNFKVSNGDLTRARYDGQSHKKLDYRPSHFQMNGLQRDNLQATLQQFGLLSKAPPLKPQSGLFNGGNYCYTNASLKLLMSMRGQALLDHLQDIHRRPEHYFGPGHTEVPEAFEEVRSALHDLTDRTLKGQDAKAAVLRFRSAIQNPELAALAHSWEDRRRQLAASREATVAPARKAEEVRDAAQQELEDAKKTGAPTEQLEQKVTRLQSAYEQAISLRKHQMEVLDAQAQADGYENLNDHISRLDDLQKIGRFADAQIKFSLLPKKEQTLKSAVDLRLLNTQQEASEFLMWIHDALRLEPQAQDSVAEINTKVRQGQIAQATAEEGRLKAQVPLKADPTTPPRNLQELVDFQFKPQAVEDGWTETPRWVGDPSQLRTLTLTLDSEFPATALANLSLNDEITVPLTDSTTGATQRIRMRARDVVMFEGRDQAGHYWMASRQAGSWTVHDDQTVGKDDGRLEGFTTTKRPRVIVLEVVPSA